MENSILTSSYPLSVEMDWSKNILEEARRVAEVKDTLQRVQEGLREEEVLAIIVVNPNPNV